MGSLRCYIGWHKWLFQGWIGRDGREDGYWFCDRCGKGSNIEQGS